MRSANKRLMAICAGVFIIAIGVLGLLAFHLGAQKPSLGVLALLAVACGAVSAMGAWVILQAVRQRLTLFADRLEYHSGWRVHVVRREEIGALRVFHASGSPHLLLLRAGDLKRLLTIEATFAADDTFDAWFAGVRNLDLEEHQAVLERASNDVSLGATPEQRFERARRISIRFFGLQGFALVACLWFSLYPHPYWLALLGNVLVVPAALAVFRRYPSVVQLGTNPNGAHPGVDLVLCFSAIALAMRTYLDVRLVTWTWLVALSILAGVVSAWLLRRVAPLSPRSTHVFCAVCLGAYFGGALALGHRLLDKSVGDAHSRSTNSEIPR